jgi:hypothetical protein
MPTITLLGGGFSGLTTGVLLHLVGYRTRCLAARHLADGGPDAPAFASGYPAASVIPHAVHVPRVAARLATSQAFFEALRGVPAAAVRVQRHAEVFEAPAPEAPAYAPALRRFRRLPADGRGAAGVPRRPGAAGVFGWTFDAYFAERPRYARWLAALYRATGGTVTTRRLAPADLPALPGDAVVNALGLGAPALFPDAAASTLLRGVLVYAPPPAPWPPAWLAGGGRAASHGPVASYNYAPSFAAYPTAGGDPGGLYAYPRRDAWVLGGSTRAGRLVAGRWVGPPPAAPTIRLPGPDGAPLAVPAPVVHLNRVLVQRLTGRALDLRRARAVVGYRYARDLRGRAADAPGVRLVADAACDAVGGRLVVHDAGHGGAGVTLSWAAAVDVARALARHGLPPPAAHGAADTPAPPPALVPPDAWARLGRLARRYVARGHRAPDPT